MRGHTDRQESAGSVMRLAGEGLGPSFGVRSQDAALQACEGGSCLCLRRPAGWTGTSSFVDAHSGARAKLASGDGKHAKGLRAQAVYGLGAFNGLVKRAMGFAAAAGGIRAERVSGAF